MNQEIKDKRYIAKLEAAVKRIPDLYYQDAMDKDWGYSTDELDEQQDELQRQIDKLIRK